MAKKKFRPRPGKRIIVIPTRMASERLPGKPMLIAAGKPLVQWTYEQAKRTDADHVIVGTGDREIANYCQKAGMTWMLTEAEHENGTSRVAEIFGKLKSEVQKQTSVVVNWQVDEPEVDPSFVNILMTIRLNTIGTLVHACEECVNFSDPNITKVVWSNEHCHWFSRVPMRGCGLHVGLYSFTPFLLRAVSALVPSRLSELESLEQLTWLEAGLRLLPIEIDRMPLSINTIEDWNKFKEMKEGK